MKRGILIAVLLSIIFMHVVCASEVCDLSGQLINQDPYPASPGEYVKAVFQIKGITNPVCGKIIVEFVEDFPYSLDPGANKKMEIIGGIYPKDYSSFLLAQYNVRVDEQAIDGENPLKLRYTIAGSNTNASYKTEEFNITIKDLHTDFEVSIKNYDKATNTLTFEILNTGEHDVEALTIDIPNQQNIAVKGSNRNIVGSLDSNEDTTFSFEATPKEGEIKLDILYNDEINLRRTIEKKVYFNPNYFTNRAGDGNGSSKWKWVFVLVVIIGAVWWWRRKIKKEKEHHRKHQQREMI
jgi:hypothetical protein